MKLEVGMYVRTKKGLGKIYKTRYFMDEYEIHLDSNVGTILNVTDNTYWSHTYDIIGEPSHNIIDLIEVGDYVNGEKVIYISEGNFKCIQTEKTRDKLITEKDIKSVVTKEQFESVSYDIE